MSNRQFALEGSPDARLGAKLLYVTRARYDADWHSTLHNHYFSELLYVLGGEGRLLINEEEAPLQANDLVIINPNIPHTETSTSRAPLEYVALGVEGIAFSFHLPGAPTGYSLFSCSRHRDDMLFYLRTLLREVETKPSDHEIVCQDLLEVMLIHLMRRVNYSLSVSTVSKQNPAALLAKQYIDEHFQEPLLLDTLAAVAHVSKYHLVHAFTEDYGLSPIHYLVARRIEESKTLLKTTNYSISEVALFSGFSSQSYFSQAFRRLTGVQPREYRQLVKADAQ